MSDHCVHSHRTYYLLHFNFRAASRTVTFEMGPSITLNSSLIMVAQGEVEEDPMVRSLPAEWGVESREVQERLRHLPLVWEKWKEAAEQMEVVD